MSRIDHYEDPLANRHHRRGIYSNPAHVIVFSDGEVRQEFSICFRARPVGGAARTSDESSEVRWIDRSPT